MLNTCHAHLQQSKLLVPLDLTSFAWMSFDLINTPFVFIYTYTVRVSVCI